MRVRGYRIFYIDEESSIKDLVELIESTTAVRMALVIKNSRLLLNSTVNLKLIKEYARKYKKEIVFVNPDPVNVGQINREGFQIYENLNALDRDEPLGKAGTGKIANGKKESHGVKEIDGTTGVIGDKEACGNETLAAAESSSRWRWFMTTLYILLALLIFGLAYLYFFYPTATVEVKPVIRTASQEISLIASTEQNRIDWQNHILPLHPTQIEISGEEEFRTTGYKMIGETPARGIVRFINERQEEVKIMAGTVLVADNGLKYRTMEDIIIPPTMVDYLMNVPVGMRAGQADVQVECLTAGSSGNIGIGRISNLESPLSDIHVINPEPITGGTDRRISIVSEEDLEKGEKLLAEELRGRLFSKIYQELGGNYRIIEDSLSFFDERYEFSHRAGEEADTLLIKGSLQASGYLIKNNELDRLLTRIFQENLPENLQLTSSGINVDTIQLEEREDKLYNIRTKVEEPVMTVIDTNSLARNLLGLDLEKAQVVLEGISDIEDYRIESQSSRLPAMGFAIKVVINQPEERMVFKLID